MSERYSANPRRQRSRPKTGSERLSTQSECNIGMPRPFVALVALLGLIANAIIIPDANAWVCLT